MPAKQSDPETVRFLYSLLLRSDFKSIDFHRVAADFSINQAAARMRWSRLRKNLGDDPALLNPFHDTPPPPPPSNTGDHPGPISPGVVPSAPDPNTNTTTNVRTSLGSSVYSTGDKDPEIRPEEGRKKPRLQTPQSLAHEKKLADARAKFSLFTRQSPFGSSPFAVGGGGGGGVPIWPQHPQQQHQQRIGQWTPPHGQFLPAWPQLEERADLQWSLPPLPALPPAKLNQQQRQNICISNGGEKRDAAGLEQLPDSDIDAEGETDIEPTELLVARRERSLSLAMSSVLSSLAPTPQPEPEPEEKIEEVREAVGKKKSRKKGMVSSQAKAEVAKVNSKLKGSARGEARRGEKKATTTTRSGRLISNRNYRQLASGGGTTGGAEVQKRNNCRKTRASRKGGSRTESKQDIEEEEEEEEGEDEVEELEGDHEYMGEMRTTRSMTSTRSGRVNRKRSYSQISSASGDGLNGDGSEDRIYPVALGDVLSDDEEDYGAHEDDEDSEWSGD